MTIGVTDAEKVREHPSTEDDVPDNATHYDVCSLSFAMMPGYMQLSVASAQRSSGVTW